MYDQPIHEIRFILLVLLIIIYMLITQQCQHSHHCCQSTLTSVTSLLLVESSSAMCQQMVLPSDGGEMEVKLFVTQSSFLGRNCQAATSLRENSEIQKQRQQPVCHYIFLWHSDTVRHTCATGFGRTEFFRPIVESSFSHF